MKMYYLLKKLFLIISLNTCVFLLLIIGIQNSSNKSRVNFLIDKTVELPIGFIVGFSFLSGSLTGSLVSLNFEAKK